MAGPMGIWHDAMSGELGWRVLGLLGRGRNPVRIGTGIAVGFAIAAALMAWYYWDPRFAPRALVGRHELPYPMDWDARRNMAMAFTVGSWASLCIGWWYYRQKTDDSQPDVCTNDDSDAS